MSGRDGYIAGLRQLADLLEANDDLPLPYSGSSANELLWIAGPRDDHKAIAQTFARTIPGPLTKKARGSDFDLIGAIDGLGVQLIVDRDQVCERIVVGTEIVEVPAQPATPATEAHTVEREVVEWRCGSVLADEPRDAWAKDAADAMRRDLVDPDTGRLVQP